MILEMSAHAYWTAVVPMNLIQVIECHPCRGLGVYSEEYNDLQCGNCDGNGELYQVEIVKQPDLDKLPF